MVLLAGGLPACTLAQSIDSLALIRQPADSAGWQLREEQASSSKEVLMIASHKAGKPWRATAVSQSWQYCALMSDCLTQNHIVLRFLVLTIAQNVKANDEIKYNGTSHLAATFRDL